MNKSNTFVLSFTAIVGGAAIWFLFGTGPGKHPDTNENQVESRAEKNESPLSQSPGTSEPVNDKTSKGKITSVIRHDAIDGIDLVIKPSSWRSRRTSTLMVPWEGQQLVFLTMENKSVDAETVKRYTAQLDEGWAIYDSVVPGTPPLRKQFNGKPTMIATPGIYAGAVGCGYIGSTGIEVTTFYDGDLEEFRSDPGSFRHYYFYEMGRNWFVFGDRFDMFCSSFAVHMRHVCMRRLGLNYIRGELTHDDMLELEAKYRSQDNIDYYQHFVGNHGFALKNVLNVRYADRNTVFTGIMLKLEDRYGEEFLPRFFDALLRCPGGIDPESQQGGEAQTVNWIAACSFAAKMDLSETFMNDYHVRLTQEQRLQFQKISWKESDAVERFFSQ